MIRGRPFRFLVSVVGGWTVMRFMMVVPLPAHILSLESQLGLPFSSRPRPAATQPVRHITPAFVAMIRPDSATRSGNPGGIDSLFTTRSTVRPLKRAVTAGALRAPESDTMRGANLPGQRIGEPDFMGGWSPPVDFLLMTRHGIVLDPNALALASFVSARGVLPGEAGVPSADGQTSRTDRWFGAAWMLWRGEGDVTRARLGGAQAGVRIDYLLVPDVALRPTLYGRISTALHGLGAAEAATGIAIRPALNFPVIVAVERRQAVSPGGRNDFAVLAAAGLNPVEVGHGFRLDGYGQAGFVGARRRDGFADGRLTLERQLDAGFAGSGPVFAAGAAVWGSVQPDASRLDVGPQLSVRMQVGGAAMRVAAEWRAQVAGNAAPSSGPTLSLGTDF